MNDLEHLVNIKINVLKSMEDILPNTVINAYENDNLCYYVNFDDGSIISVIDFEYQMPVTLDLYKRLIQQSFAEWESYSNPIKRWNL